MNAGSKREQEHRQELWKLEKAAMDRSGSGFLSEGRLVKQDGPLTVVYLLHQNGGKDTTVYKNAAGAVAAWRADSRWDDAEDKLIALADIEACDRFLTDEQAVEALGCGEEYVLFQWMRAGGGQRICAIERTRVY